MLRTLGLAALVAFAAPALADGPSYSYLEGGYSRIEFDDSLLDFDGETLALGGSFEVGDSLHVFAGYGRSDFDLGVEFDELTLGAGLHSPLTSNLDLVANLAWVRLEATAPGASVDDDGIGASLGVRGMAGDSLELAASVNYVEFDNAGDETSYTGEAWFNFTQSIALGFQANFGEDTTSYGIGARVYFGQ